MSDNQTKMRYLKTREVIGGKTIPFVLITLAFFFAQANIVYKLLMAFLDKYAHTSTEEYILDYVQSNVTMLRIGVVIAVIVMIVIAAVVSVMLFKLLSKKVPVEFSSEAEKRAHRIRTGFKWRKVYTLALAYFVLGISMKIARTVLNPGQAYKEGLFMALVKILLALIIPFVISFLFVKFFNSFMVKVTHTNVDLIEEIMMGLHNSNIPDAYRNEKGVGDIIKTLQSADATTVSGAVTVLEIKNIYLKMIKASAVVGVVIGAIAGILTFGGLTAIINSGLADIKADREASMRQDRRNKMASNIADEVLRKLGLK